ncbi:MAG: 4Fe-4S binding protein [Anaerotruncus massiliensis (ex Togo et al. 2019)]
MEITKLTAFIFSPTGTTAAVAKPLAEALLPGARIVDLTCADAEEERFGPDELVLFAAPVYGGRIPAPAAKRFARMKGEGTPALLVAVYGNRDYDDALLELCDLAEENGFRPAGAGAFLAEHSIFRSVARGRPDAADLEAVRTFAGLAREKLARAAGAGEFGPLAVKGNRPYREFSGVPLKPQADRKCVKCGACAENCPAGAIPADDPPKRTTAAASPACGASRSARRGRAG